MRRSSSQSSDERLMTRRTDDNRQREIPLISAASVMNSKKPSRAMCKRRTNSALNALTEGTSIYSRAPIGLSQEAPFERTAAVAPMKKRHECARPIQKSLRVRWQVPQIVISVIFGQRRRKSAAHARGVNELNPRNNFAFVVNRNRRGLCAGHKVASELTSIPTARRPSEIASTRVVSPPQNGSRTVSPRRVNALIASRANTGEKRAG